MPGTAGGGGGVVKISKDALAAALAVVQALRKVYKAEGERLEKSRKINRL